MIKVKLEFLTVKARGDKTDLESQILARLVLFLFSTSRLHDFTTSRVWNGGFDQPKYRAKDAIAMFRGAPNLPPMKILVRAIYPCCIHMR